MSSCGVAVIIVNWNHLRFLKDCLDSLIAQSYQSFEAVILDNGSSDGSHEWIRKNYPALSVIDFQENRGFSAAFNEGVRKTSAPYILSLNPDVTLDQDCLAYLVNALLDTSQAGLAVPKLLRADNPQVLDSTGLFINRQRCPYDRGQGEVDRGQYDHSRKVYGACGALALYRREMLVDLAYQGEFLDEDFFAYYEDADLAWRAESLGWEAIFEPQASARHMRGWGDSLRKQRRKDPLGPRLALRNRYLMILKNDRFLNFVVDFPLIFAAELPRLIYAAIFMPSVLLGLIDYVRLSRKMLRKRKDIMQKTSGKKVHSRPWLLKSQG